MASSRIGFIGLGTMGRPMASNVRKNGYPMVVYDAVPASMADLVAAGAKSASSPAEVAAASDVVITMLPDAPDVEAVATGPNGILGSLRSGAVYIDMSTIDPTTTRAGRRGHGRARHQDDRQPGRQAPAERRGGHLGADGRRRRGRDRGGAPGPDVHGRDALPLRRPGRRAGDEAHQQLPRLEPAPGDRRGARDRDQGRPPARADAHRLRLDHGRQQPAGHHAAEKGAARRFQPGLHDPAGQEGRAARGRAGAGRWACRHRSARRRWRPSSPPTRRARAERT